jgi:hypothetical protein
MAVGTGSSQGRQCRAGGLIVYGRSFAPAIRRFIAWNIASPFDGTGGCPREYAETRSALSAFLPLGTPMPCLDRCGKS